MSQNAQGRKPGRAPQDRRPPLVKKPRRTVVGLYMDDDLALRVQAAEQALQAASERQAGDQAQRIAGLAAAGEADAYTLVRKADEEVLIPLRNAVDAANAALEDATEWFVFEGIGARRLRALARAHPPTEEDAAEHERLGGTGTLEWSPVTFEPALVRDSCVWPVGYPWDDVFGVPGEEDTWGDELPPKSPWGVGEIQALVASAVHANQAVRVATHRSAPTLDELRGAG